MATVTGLTAARMLEIEAASVIDGVVNAAGHLILTTHDGTLIDAGYVMGQQIPGTMMMYGGPTAPPGSYLCDGAAYSRTVDAVLFAAIGTAYGAGNGTTTFNVPNFNGRVPVGRDPAQTEFAARGQVGGAKTHTLTLNEAPGHTHDIFVSIAGRAQLVSTTAADTGTATNRYTIASGTGAPYLVSDAKGGNQPHNNLQPYLTVNMIIFK